MKAQILSFLIVFLAVCSFQNLEAKEIHNRHFKFKMTLPDAMAQIMDSSSSAQGELYYDTIRSIILLVSARDGKFNSVNDYIDCRKEQLEQQLKDYYGDSSLTLLHCSRSLYYPRKSTALNFRVSGLPYGYNIYIIYFIHHKGKDIQISFTYKAEKEQASLAYINAIMQTLKLK